MKTIRQKYAEIKQALATLEEADAEAMRILHATQGMSMGELPLFMDRECLREGDIDAIVEKRLTGAPLAYALQSKCFYGYEFYVTPSVLIPRYDSECVVERAIHLQRERQYESALDLCCGSGALGIALLLESGIKTVCFSDTSKEALQIARENAALLLRERAKTDCAFVCGDLFENIPGKVDLLLCNPPYVSEAEYAGLDRQILEFEPSLALVAQKDGYEFYERLANDSRAYLNDGGALVFEIGSSQYERVHDLLKTAGFVNIECGFDLGGQPRFVSADIE